MAPLVPLSDQECQVLRRTLGLQCHRAREALGLSQRRLAEVMGRSASWVREIERGDQYAPPYFVAALSRATRCSPAWFYGAESDVDGVAERLLDSVRRLIAEEDVGAPAELDRLQGG